jgi:hypothetical protein
MNAAIFAETLSACGATGASNAGLQSSEFHRVIGKATRYS